MILDYFIKQKDLYKTFIIISIVHSIIIVNSHFFKDYFNKDKNKDMFYFVNIIYLL